MATREENTPEPEDVLDDPQDDPQDDPLTLTEEDLPEDLRGLPKDKVRQTLSAMVRATTTGAERIRELERRLDESRRASTPSHAREFEPEEDGEELDLKELILDEPEKAIIAVAKKYGLLDRLERSESTAGDVAFMRASKDLPQFDSYHERVEEILSATGSPRTFEHVRGAYLMARGERDVEREVKRSSKRTAPEQPKGAPPEGEKKEFSPLMRDISAQLGVEEDEIEKYLAEGPFEMEVPGDRTAKTS